MSTKNGTHTQYGRINKLTPAGAVIADLLALLPGTVERLHKVQRYLSKQMTSRDGTGAYLQAVNATKEIEEVLAWLSGAETPAWAKVSGAVEALPWADAGGDEFEKFVDWLNSRDEEGEGESDG